MRKTRFFIFKLFLILINFTLFANYACAPIPASIHPPPEEFGYATSRANGKSAFGVRPLLVILIQFDDTQFQSDHTISYYENIIWGDGFGTSPNIAGIGGFFDENSYGKFRFTRTEILGPFNNTDDPNTTGNEGNRDCAFGRTGGPSNINNPNSAWTCGAWVWNPSANKLENRSAWKIYGNAIRLASENGFDFKPFDSNNDNVVTKDELTILTISSSPQGAGGSNRATIPASINVDFFGLQVRLAVADVAEFASISTIAHELTHNIGIGYEAYGGDAQCMSMNYTTMSCTYGAESQRIIHLDPFTKMKLGWLTPHIYSNNQSDCLSLRNVETFEDAVLIYNTTRPEEFFLIENRQAILKNYDNDPWGIGINGLPDNGLGIWYIQVQPDSAHKPPAPVPPLRTGNFERALYLIPPIGSTPNVMSDWGRAPSGNGLWSELDPVAKPTWLDGTDSNVRLEITDNSKFSGMKLKLGDPVCLAQQLGLPDRIKLFPCIEVPVNLPYPNIANKLACKIELPDFILERNISPYPPKPNSTVNVTWSIIPKEKLSGNSIKIVDQIPNKWKLKKGKNIVEFSEKELNNKKNLSSSYEVTVQNDIGAIDLNSKVIVGLSSEKNKTKFNDFVLKSNFRIWDELPVVIPDRIDNF